MAQPAVRAGDGAGHLVKHLLQKGLAKAGDIYQFFEGSMKLAKMMYEVEQNGLSRDDAYLEAQKWLFDYSEVPRTVRYLRNAPIGVPFVDLPVQGAAAHPRGGRHQAVAARALRRRCPGPWRALFAWMYGVDDDDVDKLRKALPEWMRKKQNAVVLGRARTSPGRWRLLRLRLPPALVGWQEAAGELAEGHPVRAAREMGVGGPFADIGAALLTNVDPFTQRPIADPRDPPERRRSTSCPTPGA